MDSENLKTNLTNQIGPNRMPLIGDSAAGPLVKQLIAIAEREEGLLRELADAIALDRTDAIVETARKLVAGRHRQRPDEAENCAGLAG